MSSIITVGALYVFMTSAFLSVIPWRQLLDSKFIASTYVEELYGPAAGKLMTALVLWIAFSSAFSLLLGYSRIPYVAATDGNFFRVFARLHPQGDFPHVSLITLGIMASVFSLGKLNEVIPGLIATRVLIQYLPQTIGFFLLRRGFRGLQILGGNLLEHRILDHFLVQKIREFERRHRQQLDRLLERRRENELLDELRVKFLLDTH